MNAIFIDTFYYLAILNPRDASHSHAMKVTSGLAGRLFTTEFVLLEVADALSHPTERLKFLELFDYLASQSEVTVIEAST